MTFPRSQQAEKIELEDFRKLGGRSGEPSVHPASEDLTSALQDFQPILDGKLRGLLVALPWVIILIVTVRAVAFPLRPGVVMYLSSLLAVAVALLGFQLTMNRLKELPGLLWERKLIDGRSGSRENAAPEEYAAFVRNFGRMLNGQGQFFAAALLGAAGAAWVLYAALRGAQFTVLIAFWEVTLAFSLGAFLGLLAWRMIVTGNQIHRLGKDFDLRLQLGHPDRCGGFSPLGYLCLASACVISIAGVHLGGWLVVGPSLPGGYRDLAADYHDLYLVLLVVPLSLASVSFFWPMWSVHKEMLSERDRIQGQLDQISHKIDELARKVLSEADELDPATLEATSKQLAGMRATYTEYEKVPTWPFDTRILYKFFTTQTVPLLGLTGIGAPLLKTISSLLSFLDKPT